jgi:hypothetical protein
MTTRTASRYGINWSIAGTAWYVRL